MSLALSSPPGEPALRVNKRELARILGVSRPTVDSLLERHPELPRLQEGTNGKEWLFDPFAVREFLAEQEAETQRQEAVREAQIAQLGLPIEEQDPDLDLLKPSERLAHVRALAAEDKLRLERGHLVSVPSERQALTSAIGRWNRALHACVRTAGRDLNLPEAIVRALEERLAETQRQFVRDLRLDADGARTLA